MPISIESLSWEIKFWVNIKGDVAMCGIIVKEITIHQSSKQLVPIKFITAFSNEKNPFYIDI